MDVFRKGDRARWDSHGVEAIGEVLRKREVVGGARRHLAQEPAKESIEGSRWRRSSLDRGRNPLEKGGRRAG